MNCACGCGQEVPAHDGRGRHGKYYSDACRQRHYRNKKANDSSVTKLNYDVTQITNSIIQGDALAVLKRLPDACVQCVVTSPPYWNLRDYGVAGQLGLESTPQEYIAKLVEVCREIRRILRPDGTFWCNIGDSYATATHQENKVFGNPAFNANRPSRSLTKTPKHGVPAMFKSKDLLMIPSRLAIALQEDGWYLRSDIIWHKPTAMPESVTDRPTTAHEHILLLAKSERYYYDADAIREPLKEKTYTTFGIKHRAQGNDALGLVKSDNWGRTVVERQPRLTADGEIAGANKRTVWTVASQPYEGAHFATFPPKLIEPCILAGSSPRACEHCLSPWQRITETTGGTWEERKAAGVPTRYGLQSSKGTPINTMGHTQSITTGWQPTCKCENNTGAGKCIILDPFMGAGTVAMVALQHGRNYIGIELNAEYISLAQRRIEVAQPQLWTGSEAV